MSKKNDLYGRFDDMVDAVLDPPPTEDKRDRKPTRPKEERLAKRQAELRPQRDTSRRSKPR